MKNTEEVKVAIDKCADLRHSIQRNFKHAIVNSRLHGIRH